MIFSGVTDITIPEGSVSKITAGDTMLWGKSSSILPSGYIQVEYIQAKTIDEIITDYLPNMNTRIVMDITYWETNNNPIYAYGCDGYMTSPIGFYTNNSKLTARFGSESISFTNYQFSNQSRMIIDQNKTTVTVYHASGSLAYSGSITSNTFTNTTKYFSILGRNSNSTAYNLSCLYSCKIYEDDTLLHDFIPCINSSDTAGVYDIVENKFFGPNRNNGFNTGPAV